MNDCKMYNMPIDVESKYKNKNTQGRLYLSLVHFKKKTEKVRRKVRLTIFKFLLSLLPTLLVASWAIPTAYNQRGYDAIGGEWLLIIVVLGFSFNFISNHIDRKIRKERRRRRRMKYYYQGK